uniref:hypothetical protein n=1 Tax=Yoonia sp. TaxID=2212373 RepID=UPI0040483A84|tara:strand:+ start:95 stop:316 length:222 start_codon:yes stop_codon:yes gene_type:complete
MIGVLHNMIGVQNNPGIRRRGHIRIFVGIIQLRQKVAHTNHSPCSNPMIRAVRASLDGAFCAVFDVVIKLPFL